MVDRERERVAHAYEGYAESDRKRRSWAAENPGNIAIRAEVVQRAFELGGPELTGARALLDVGCGSGWWLEKLAGRADVRARLHGVEILSERITAAHKRVPEAELVVADGRALPYDPSSFDVVSMLTFLSSLSGRDDVLAALREAARVLAPRGVLLIWEPRVPNPLNANTLLVSRGLVLRALPGASIDYRSTTLVPALARRLGERAYGRLVRVGALRTHWLMCVRPPEGPVRSRQ